MRRGLLPRAFLVVRLLFLVPQLRCLHHQVPLQSPLLKRLSSGLGVALTCAELVARLCVMSCCVAVLLTVLACVGALALGFCSTAVSSFFVQFA